MTNLAWKPEKASQKSEPRVYKWLTYDEENKKKAKGCSKDFFELTEPEWIENDPRFVAQSMLNHAFYVWDDLASFLTWYEGIEASQRCYCEWIRGDQHQKLKFDFDLEYKSEIDRVNRELVGGWMLPSTPR